MAMNHVDIEGFELSPQQRHLWGLMRHHRGASPSRARCTVRMHGPLDAALLTRVLTETAARHEILRTTFYTSEEIATPLQVIGPADSLHAAVKYHDLTAADDEARRAMAAAIHQRIDLTAASDA